MGQVQLVQRLQRCGWQIIMINVYYIYIFVLGYLCKKYDYGSNGAHSPPLLYNGEPPLT